MARAKFSSAMILLLLCDLGEPFRFYFGTEQDYKTQKRGFLPFYVQSIKCVCTSVNPVVFIPECL